MCLGEAGGRRKASRAGKHSDIAVTGVLLRATSSTPENASEPNPSSVGKPEPAVEEASNISARLDAPRELAGSKLSERWVGQDNARSKRMSPSSWKPVSHSPQAAAG